MLMATLVGDLRNAAGDQFKAIIFDVVLFGRHWGFELADIEVPVWFWHGDADFFVPLSHGEAMADTVEGAVLHFRPGAGHLATLEMTRGKYASYFWISMLLMVVALAAPWMAVPAVAAGLIGLLAFEHAYVQAGQSVPLA